MEAIDIKIEFLKYTLRAAAVFLACFGFLGIAEFVFICINTSNLYFLFFDPTHRQIKSLIILDAMCIPFYTAFCTGIFALSLGTICGCSVSPDGIYYPKALIFRNFISWSEIDDIHPQWGSYLLRKQLPDGVWVAYERVNNVWGEKVCCLPKPFLMKNRDEVLRYLAAVVPQGNILRQYLPNLSAT